MDRLFSPVNFLDFGPAALHTGPVSLHHLNGNRSAQLRRGVREHCPRHPGVYGMLDTHGELIYVGKAKSLRTRLLSYFRPRSRDRKATRIVGQIRGILWETSADEFAALHRELELIRRWRPRYNVQGKPHRWQHTYVCLGRGPAPYAFLARRPPARVLASFGPVSAGQRAREGVRRLNDWFRLRDCPKKQTMVFADETELFAAEYTPGCMRLELNTCTGPCAAACTRGDYGDQVRAARAFLAGADPAPLLTLEKQMLQAATVQAFERATVLRDKLAALSWLHRQLDQLRQAAVMEPMIYPIVGHDEALRWYLLQAGRAVAAAVVPEDPGARAALLRQWQTRRVRSTSGGEHLAGVLLLASWLRRFPEEGAKLQHLAETSAKC